MNFSTGATAGDGMNCDAVRRLIHAAVSDPGVRMELHAHPVATALRFGLSEAQARAIELVQASVMAAMGGEALGRLDELLMAQTRLPGPVGQGAPGLLGSYRLDGRMGGCNPDAMAG
ncbi:MAG TPA: hypothetical protein VN222_00890 [Novosphingobium sp.]|nr:hypothetical protein [Novosphingobium sp.]